MSKWDRVANPQNPKKWGENALFSKFLSFLFCHSKILH